MIKHYHLTAVIWKEGKHYVSKCPELGVASYGSTLEKARTALEEGVELYISKNLFALLQGHYQAASAKSGECDFP